MSRKAGGHRTTSSLQSLMLGYASERLMQSIQLPSCLQSMTFGREVNQNLEGTQLLNCLHSLMFGYAVNRSLEGIQLPSSLQSLMFGESSNLSLACAELPSSLHVTLVAISTREVPFVAANAAICPRNTELSRSTCLRCGSVHRRIFPHPMALCMSSWCNVLVHTVCCFSDGPICIWGFI